MTQICQRCGEAPAQELTLCVWCYIEVNENPEGAAMEEFSKRVHGVWGNPRRVADIAFNELFCYGAKNVDFHNPQDVSNYALTVGILAGEMKEKTPAEFIAAFKEKALNDK